MESGPKSVFSQASRLKKYIASVVIFYGGFTFGVYMPFLNPTMLDFSRKFDSSVDHISKVFSVSLATYLFGALSGGIIQKFLSRQFFAIIVLTITAVALFTIPFAESVLVFFALAGFMGLGGGGYDTAQLAWIIDIWRNEAGPFILTQHFAISVGRLVPPLLLSPYLTEEQDGSIENSTTTAQPYESKFYIPFSIGAGLVLIAIVSHIAIYILAFRPQKSATIIEDSEKDEKVQEQVFDYHPNPTEDSLKRKILLVVLVCCVLGFYQGMEMCTAQFMPTFSHFSKVGLSEKKSANIAVGFQLGFAAGRFLGIFLVVKLAPHFLLAGNFILIMVSNIILLIWGGSNVTWLWIGSIFLGFGMSTVLPAVYAYIKKYIFITDSIASIVAVSGGLVACIYPIVLWKTIQKL